MAYTRDDDQLMVAFGKRLRASRIAAGYEEASTIASDLGLGDQAYRKYERGESMPPPAVLKRICGLVNKTLDCLILGVGDQPDPNNADSALDA